MIGILLGMLKKLGSSASFTVGVGTSLLCLLKGHFFMDKVPEWVAQHGCQNCGGVGTNPDTPDGGGRRFGTECSVCNGSGIDPARPLPEDWGQKKRKRRRKQEPQGLLGTAPVPAFRELVETNAVGPWMDALDWWRTVWGEEDPTCDGMLCGGGAGWKHGPRDPDSPARPGKYVKIARPSCRVCGARNPAFTEPPEQIGLVGRLLRWLF